MGKLTKIDAQSINTLPAGIMDTPELKELFEKLHKRRKERENTKTPSQFKENRPGGNYEYVHSVYMIDQLKAFCNELYEVVEQKFTDIFLPTAKDGNNHWVRCEGRFKDKTSGNIIGGVGCSLMKGGLDYSHVCTSAETKMWKDFGKHFGIGADVYKKDIDEFSEETNAIINDTVAYIEDNLSNTDLQKFKMQIRFATEEEAIEIVKDFQAREEARNKQRQESSNNLINTIVQEYDAHIIGQSNESSIFDD